MSRRRVTHVDDRGQTNFDFLVGVTVFLLAAGFVLATLSGMVDPFVGGQEKTLVADRTATLLAGGYFAGSGSGSAANETCTFGFFNHTYAPANGTACSIGFRANQSDLADRLGVDDRYSINVTIRRAEGDGTLAVRCTDGDRLVACPGETRLAAGASPPADGSIVSARRTMYLDGTDVVLEVRVW